MRSLWPQAFRAHRPGPGIQHPARLRLRGVFVWAALTRHQAGCDHPACNHFVFCRTPHPPAFGLAHRLAAPAICQMPAPSVNTGKVQTYCGNRTTRIFSSAGYLSIRHGMARTEGMHIVALHDVTFALLCTRCAKMVRIDFPHENTGFFEDLR